MKISCKCRLRSSIGTTCAFPPPLAPPLIPKQGPKEGSLRVTRDFTFSFPKAWPKPIVVVVFPSPAGVGLIAVTKTNLPSGFPLTLSHSSLESFPLYLP